MSETIKAVILARGLGTRMRKAATAAPIDARQAAVADTGVKAMIPIGRPFLDYVISALADAGLRDICLVVGPEHEAIRRHYAGLAPSRVRIVFAVQREPLGTADAVLAAGEFAGSDHFLVLNSDNYYPVEVLARLREMGRPCLAGFDRTALVRESNIDDERVQKYAVLTVDAEGFLTGILEKPDEETWRRVGEHALISMNVWCFGPAILRAGGQIRMSARGEYELADAVQYAMTGLGERFAVVPVSTGVLDLSVRTDIPSVARRLQGVEVRL
jgi:dTDP-glucose pyrophosphorylase